jgi:Protein of unknown function (DUF3631)/Domain of unknown function (DUF3854)
MLKASAIADDVVEERGYFSVKQKGELEHLGFGRSQQLVPSLVIPIHSVIPGENPWYVHRPDDPRVKDGRTRKYEIPVGRKMALDIHPRVRANIRSGDCPLFITEGSRRVDSLITAGAKAVIGLVGVWNWRGTNDANGKVMLADWEDVHLKGRQAYVVFDSDILLKQSVSLAMNRLGAALQRRGAAVAYTRLPSGPGGAKVGADDFVAAGRQLDDIVRLSTASAPEPSAGGDRRATPLRHAVKAPATTPLLERIGVFIRRFVILPSPAGYLAVSLFVLHTWAFTAAHATPYAVVESPEKQSGKTRLLEVLALICRNPLMVASITAAALFQSVSEGFPTLLIDEVDAIFAGSSERNEDLRGVLNAGNVPGSPVIRGGKDGKPVSYDVFSQKVIAGIATGKLPDTVRDRAIVIPIDRKLRTERVQRLRRRRLKDELVALRDACAAWAEENHERLVEYDLPEPMHVVSDRMEEAWEPLLAIADLAGGAYPAKARAAAEDLSGVGDDDNATASHMLLMALKDVFGDREKMFSKDIVAAINADDDLGFGTWSDGAGIKAHEIGRLLKRYRTRPRKLRQGEKTLQGYLRGQFVAAWERYGADLAGTSGTTPVNTGDSGDPGPGTNAECSGSENVAIPDEIRDVPSVPDKTGPEGTEGDDDDPDGIFADLLDRLRSDGSDDPEGQR